MKNIEYIRQMLRSKGIEWREDNDGEGNHTLIVRRGYIGFITIFTFDNDGNFQDIGAYE